MSIDPRAIVDPSAKIGENVTIGPFSIIGADVEIGDESWIGPHVVIEGPTVIGKQNKIFQFASIGGEPQDKKYAGEPTRLEMGDRNVVREYVTISRGTVQDQGITSIGSDNWIMAYVHIAHDCIVGNNTIFANSASLAGHAKVGDYAILGGFTLVHQFAAIGAHSFCGMGSAISKDIPPFVMVSGNPAHPHGLNSEGLKRRGFTDNDLVQLKRAYRTLYRSKLTLEQALETLREQAGESDAVQTMVTFLEGQTRGILR